MIAFTAVLLICTESWGATFGIQFLARASLFLHFFETRVLRWFSILARVSFKEMSAFSMVVCCGKHCALLSNITNSSFKNRFSEPWLFQLADGSPAFVSGGGLSGFVSGRGLDSSWRHTRKRTRNASAIAGSTKKHQKFAEICQNVYFVLLFLFLKKRDVQFTYLLASRLMETLLRAQTGTS